MRVANCLSRGLTLLLGLFLAGLTFAAGAGEIELATAPDNIKRAFGTSLNGNDDKWGGVVFPQPPSSGHFTAVQGSFTVPKILVPAEGEGVKDNWQAAIHVGFGGTTNNNNYWIQVGVLLFVRPSGNTMYRAFHVWYPNSDPIFDDEDLDISEGDKLTVRVESYSNTSGIAIVENHTTGKGVHKILESPPDAPPLLGQHAEWFVSEPVDHQLADFGTIDITDAIAYTSDGKNIGPGEGGALVATIQEDGKLMTETVVRGRELTVAYKPHAKQERHVSEKRRLDPNFPGGSAGVRFSKPSTGGTYRAIQGTFTVPVPSLPANPVDQNFTAVIAIKIGGTAEAEEPAVSVGVSLIINSQGDTVWYQPFARWGGYVTHFEWFPNVAAGDSLTLRLQFNNDTSVRAIIRSKDDYDWVDLSNGVPIIGYHAEWAVTDPLVKDPHKFPTHEAFADFGAVDFTNAFVSTADGRDLVPENMTGVYVETELIYSPEGVPMTDVRIEPNLVSIVYKPLPADQGSGNAEDGQLGE